MQKEKENQTTKLNQSWFLPTLGAVPGPHEPDACTQCCRAGAAGRHHGPQETRGPSGMLQQPLGALLLTGEPSPGSQGKFLGREREVKGVSPCWLREASAI